MKRFRIFVLVLSLLQLAISGFTALVGLFADGGDVWSRLLLVVVHPLGAASLLYAVFLPKPGVRVLLVVVAFQVINVAADTVAALLIASGAIKGDWGLPLVFSVIPVIGIVYLLGKLRNSTT